MVLFHCGNEAVCHKIQSGTSRDPALMSLVRELFYISARNDFVCSAVHVPGCHNEAADALSRELIHLFHRLKPEANVFPTSQIQISFDY